MICPSCHTQNRDDARFCKRCGMSFPSGQTEAPGINVQEPAVVTSAPKQSKPTEDFSSHAMQEQVPKFVQTTVEGGEQDPSLMPTQILTPAQMMAFHARRWQEETKTEQSPTQSEGSPQDTSGSAEAPTHVFPSAVPASFQPDITSLPTMIIAPPTSEDASTVPISLETPETSKKSSSATDITTPAVAADKKDTSAGAASIAEPSRTNGTTVATPEKEGTMEQGASSPLTKEQNQPGQSSPAADFPALAVGSTVAGRYEITEDISTTEDEHTYHAIDRQGYQHCWNCGSEQNAQGDEFCIDCGAELLNASYTLHEYAASESNDNEAHVLQGTIINTFVEQGRTYVVEQQQPAQISFPNGVHLLAASDSDAGAIRRGEPNEDSTLVLLLERVHESLASPAGIFVVADGMGGHDNGQGASRMAINLIAQRIVHELLLPPLEAEKASEPAKERDEDDFIALVHTAIEDANSALCQVNQRDASDMGSTLTGFMMVGDHAYIFNVGDSRTYMLRDGNLYQLTTDHSLVGQMVAGGLIEPDDVYTHPQRSQIYRSLGDKLSVQIDIFKQQVHPGDVLLSCCDGLWEMVRDPQIRDILSNAPDPQTACTQLIEAANANGGEDNISAVIVFVH